MNPMHQPSWSPCPKPLLTFQPPPPSTAQVEPRPLLCAAMTVDFVGLTPSLDRQPFDRPVVSESVKRAWWERTRYLYGQMRPPGNVCCTWLTGVFPKFTSTWDLTR